ncbi:MAG: 3-hydroxybutyryl-CoA dehydrogenase [Bacteroidia bacterium]|nr:3-hydroxybutyryl-CoA dehydrogenase [Bacteroidia bacterium]
MRIGVAGAGAMGSGIAQTAAMAGHTVLLFDESKQAVEKAFSSITSSLQKLEEKRKIKNAGEVIKKITAIEALKDFAPCGFFIEAIIENLEAKRKLFSAVEAVISDECILASNTSSLSIASLAASCKNPERFIGVHFFNPPVLMKLVEIIPGIRTSQEVTVQTLRLIQSWSKTTVIAEDTPGFIVNRIARPYYGEAIRIFEEGIASPATIDHAMKTLGGFKMGPFELMDFIGNDINFNVTETVWQQMFYDARYRPSQTQKRLYEAGMFGRKSGRGYYEYKDGQAVIPPPAEDKKLLEEIFMRILFMLINEAADALHFQIASAQDIETAMTLGVNYPKGLLHWADETGIEKVYRTLLQLNDTYREERYRPSVLLKRKVEFKEKFFK